MKLNVKEIFYSLQGEGARMGEASIFIRLTRCNLQCDFCDTDFVSGEDMSLPAILDEIIGYPCRWIIWTGGEPTLQLTDEALLFFKQLGYKQAVESNGMLPLSSLLDYTVCSPKGNPAYAKRVNACVNEVRLPVRRGALIPDIAILPKANVYFLSPVFETKMESTKLNIDYCVTYIKEHSEWKLSLQMHQLIGIE